MYQVFISHKTAELTRLKDLESALKQVGIEYYAAERSYQPGDFLYEDKIKPAIRKSDCTLVFLTSRSVTSPDVNQEIGIAEGYGKKIIALVEKGVLVSGVLPGREYINYDPQNPGPAIDQVIKSLVKMKDMKNKYPTHGDTLDEFIKLQKSTRKTRMIYNFIDYYYRQYRKEYDYSSHMLKPFDQPFPVLIFPAPKAQQHDVESIISRIALNTYPPKNYDGTPLAEAGKKFLDILSKGAKPPWDSPGYKMLELKDGEKLEMECGLTMYFTTITTADVLDYELLKAFSKMNPTTSKFPMLAKELKLRNQVHAHESSVLKPEGRNAGIGISVALIFRSETGFNTLIKMRSNEVAKYPGFVHVIPSFQFEPISSYSKEFSIKHSIYKEYLEELFGKEEVSSQDGKVAPYNFFYGDNNLEYLKKLETQGKAKLYFTGVSINLMNLSPEICVLLIINDSEWFQNHYDKRKGSGLNLDPIKTNWEFAGSDISDGSDFKPEGTGIVPLDKNLEFPKETQDYLMPEKFFPSGAAALWLGIETAKKELHKLSGPELKT